MRIVSFAERVGKHALCQTSFSTKDGNLFCFHKSVGRHATITFSCPKQSMFARTRKVKFLVKSSLIENESVKWRALRAFDVGVPPVPSCPHAPIVGVPSCHRCWRGLVSSCPNFWPALVPSMLACPRVLVPKFSACPRAFDVDVQDTLEGCDP